MKIIMSILFLLLFVASCKDKPVNPYDNGLVGNWKMVSVTTSPGAVTTNPTATELITIFTENSSTLNFTNGSSSGGGSYSLSKDNSMKITVSRGDKGGWLNGAWLDLYLLNMNKSNSYQLSATQLTIKTTDNSTVLFSKL